MDAEELMTFASIGRLFRQRREAYNILKRKIFLLNDMEFDRLVEQCDTKFEKDIIKGIRKDE